MSARLPVLLLHGWGGSFASTWAATGWTDELARRSRRVIARDLPGHGAAIAASRDPASYADLAGTLAASLPAEPMDVIGYSLGAKLALALASADRARFGRIVIAGLGDNLFAPEAQGDLLAEVLEGGGPAAPPPPVAALAAYALAAGNDGRVMAAVLRRPANPVISPGLLPDGQGILIVNSPADAIAMPDFRLREAMPGHAYATIPDCGHLELPADPRLRRAALDFWIGDPARLAEPMSPRRQAQPR